MVTLQEYIEQTIDQDPRKRLPGKLYTRVMHLRDNYMMPFSKIGQKIFEEGLSDHTYSTQYIRVKYQIAKRIEKYYTKHINKKEE